MVGRAVEAVEYPKVADRAEAEPDRVKAEVQAADTVELLVELVELVELELLVELVLVVGQAEQVPVALEVQKQKPSQPPRLPWSSCSFLDTTPVSQASCHFATTVRVQTVPISDCL